MSKSIKKPVISAEDALAFAESAEPTPDRKPARRKKTAQKRPPAAAPRSGLVPEGDRRLTANIARHLHDRLKLTSVKRNTTVGEIIEDLVDKHLPPLEKKI